MKKVILLIGCSGSGKSTKAKELFEQFSKQELSVKIVSADYYFNSSGEYKFNGAKLGLAHDWCKAEYANALHNQYNIVIVDNTNTTEAERYFYGLVAENLGYEVELVYIAELDADVCHKRNVHGVPLESIKAQLKRIEANK